MAEDDGLADGDAAVDVAEGAVLVPAALAHEVVLADGAERELLLPQLDDDGVGHELRGELPHGRLEGGREEQQLAVGAQRPAGTHEALRVDHDVGLVQHEDADGAGVEEAPLEAPVEHGARRADDDLLLQPRARRHCGPKKTLFTIINY
uniref:Uncharacterized protein n=1 Tax=Nothoprocta perdicaria TaxID=30464 RepID=A0A8C7EFK6_NOTPE